MEEVTLVRPLPGGGDRRAQIKLRCIPRQGDRIYIHGDAIIHSLNFSSFGHVRVEQIEFRDNDVLVYITA